MRKQKVVTALMLVSVLVLFFAKHAEANGSSSVETLAQQALEKHTKKWLEFLPHTRGRQAVGSKSTAFDEYDLKSSDGKIVLRKFAWNIGDSEENSYQIFRINNHGVGSKPSDDALRKILRENDIADLRDYVGILENLTQYRKNNIKATLRVVRSPGEAEELEFLLSAQTDRSGRLDISGVTDTEYIAGPLGKIAPNKIAYLYTLSIEKKYQGLGLSYPLMCVAFHAAKDLYGDEYVLLQDTTREDLSDLYEKMGFKILKNSRIQAELKYAAMNDLLNSDRCRNMNR